MCGGLRRLDDHRAALRLSVPPTDGAADSRLGHEAQRRVGERDDPSRKTRMMRNLVSRFMADQSGSTAIEYGLIASFIALAIITGVRRIGTNLTVKFNAIANNLT